MKPSMWSNERFSWTRITIVLIGESGGGGDLEGIFVVGGLRFGYFLIQLSRDRNLALHDCRLL